MRHSYERALAPGTSKNKAIQAAQYIRFMIIYNFDYLNPSVAEISMYTQFLANSHSSPATVRNYLSGAKTWVQHHLGNIFPFQSYELSNMVKSVTSASDHVPSQALPLSPKDIKIICTYLDNSLTFPKAVKPCILFSFATFLRASNLVSPTLTSWGGPHTLLTSDVSLYKGFIVIRVNSTKTLKNQKPVFLEIFPVQGSNTCPVQAWLNYKSAVNPCPMGPAFVSDTGLPLTTGPIVLAMRQALSIAGHPNPSQVSFHSLRRGGAQAAAHQGASDHDLMCHGIWKTKSGLAAYVPNSPRTIPRSISRSLAN